MQRFDSAWGRVKRWLVLLPLVAAGCAHRGAPASIPLTESFPPFSESGDSELPNRWWTAFNDPKLDHQIHHALVKNYSLAAALQRVSAARALARREASDLWPDLNGVADIGGTFGPGKDRANFPLGVDAAYQVDLWGEIESRVDAERFRAKATCADYHAIALTLSGEIARTWFSLVEAYAQTELLEEQIKTNRTGLELQELRFGLGLIRSADVLRQRQLLESTLEQAVIAESRIKVLEHQLAVLMGEMPQTASYETGSDLPDLPPLPATGLPCELVHRRPDVRRDYLALKSADRDLASAISAQYPRLSLTGSVLSIAERPETIFRDWFVFIGGQLIAPLLDGGQRRAEVDRTCAVKRELLNEYSQTILVAFREVEDSLAREKYQLLRIEHLKAQVKLAGQASGQLREQYLIGDVEYLDVLSASTGQQSLQRQLLSAQLDLVLIRVSLYLALAGDFEAAGGYLPYLQDPRQDDQPVEVADSSESKDLSEALQLNDERGPENTEGDPAATDSNE
jgi:NodT family efflux transporter outer membrane factor (OMF) lipoprotein